MNENDILPAWRLVYLHVVSTLALDSILHLHGRYNQNNFSPMNTENLSIMDASCSKIYIDGYRGQVKLLAFPSNYGKLYDPS